MSRTRRSVLTCRDATTSRPDPDRIDLHPVAATGLVPGRRALDHESLDTAGLECAQPLAGLIGVCGDRGHLERRDPAPSERLKSLAANRPPHRPNIDVADGQYVECDKRRWLGRRQAPPHRGRGVDNPLLQRVEVEPVPGPHHQLAVQHAVGGELGFESCLDIRELGGDVLTVARPQPDLAVVANHSGAEPVPLHTSPRRAYQAAQAVARPPGQVPALPARADRAPAWPPSQCCSRQASGPPGEPGWPCRPRNPSSDASRK
jgi:hypothetical protein